MGRYRPCPCGSLPPTSKHNSHSQSPLPAHQTSTLITIALESCSEISAKSAVEALKTAHHITHLDILIANAGIGHYRAPASSTSISEPQNHFLINTIGPLILFQVTSPLLKASPNPALYSHHVCTREHCLYRTMHGPRLPHTGAPRPRWNFLTRKIHQENAEMTAFIVFLGGLVDTELGNASAEAAGLAKAPDT